MQVKNHTLFLKIPIGNVKLWKRNYRRGWAAIFRTPKSIVEEDRNMEAKHWVSPGNFPNWVSREAFCLFVSALLAYTVHTILSYVICICVYMYIYIHIHKCTHTHTYLCVCVYLWLLADFAVLPLPPDAVLKFYWRLSVKELMLHLKEKKSVC